MLPEWTPSQKADVALRMFRGTKRVARIPLCAETAEKYRELMFLVARDELNKFLARHPDPNKNPRSPEWQIQTLMYRSGVVARSPDADSRTLSPQPEWVDFGSVRTALDSVQGQVYGDGSRASGTPAKERPPWSQKRGKATPSLGKPLAAWRPA